MENISVHLLENCKKNKKLSNKDLIILYKSNKDLNARNELIVNNIGLVYIAAKKRMNIKSSFTFEDLVQEGVIGMIKGIEKFDINRNTSFSTYIYYWINHQIDRALMDNGHLVRLPAYICEKINKMNNVENSNQALEKDLNVKSLCKEIKMTQKEYNTIDCYRKSYYNFTSLNTIINLDNDDSSIELQDFIPSNEPSIEEIVINKDLQKNLSKVLNTLSPREREILELRFGIKNNKPSTLEEIGKKYNVTRERIRQIESKALQKIKNSKNKKILLEYLSYP